jgi:hypothetical protein
LLLCKSFSLGGFTAWLIAVCRPFNIRCVKHSMFTRICSRCNDNDSESVKASTLPATSPLDKPIYVPPRTRYDCIFVLIFKHDAHNGPSVSYSVFLMHRRKDLWGPDGTPFPGLNDLHSHFCQPRNSIPTASSTKGYINILSPNRSSSSPLMLAPVSVLGSR